VEVVIITTILILVQGEILQLVYCTTSIFTAAVTFTYPITNHKRGEVYELINCIGIEKEYYESRMG
jgi:hypothetical protein